MAPNDVKKTTVITKSSLYDWNVMPFRLKNATSTFSRTMAGIFKEWINQFVKVFIDDVKVHSGTWNEHLGHIRSVLQKLKEVNLKLNPSKFCFGSKSITFLGHVVDNARSQLDPRKIVTVQHFPTPKTATNVKAFLGLTGYYMRFIAGYAKIVEPLFTLTKKDCKFLWMPICHSAFIALKRRFVEAHVLVKPDFNKSFILDVDWSIKGVGAILSQKVRRQEQVIAYASKGLSLVQCRFHPMEGECYALIWGIMYFKQYLYQTPFLLRTDHKPLEWLVIVLDAYGRRGRWITML